MSYLTENLSKLRSFDRQ